MDNDLRTLERAAKLDPSLLTALNRARRRAGLRAARVVHYVTADVHYRLDESGSFSPRFGYAPVYALCRSAEVWPRTSYPKQRRSAIHYTSDRTLVTCKTCERKITHPDFRESPAPTHLRVEPPDRGPYSLCGAAMMLSTTVTKAAVTCPTCRGKFMARPDLAVRPQNARDRRRERRRMALSRSR